METRVRLFFAVLPDPAMRERIGAAAAGLALSSGCRLVTRDSYHMTLAFVGNVALRQLPILMAIGAAQRMTECSVRFDAYEHWPKTGVVVAAAGIVPAALEQLSHQLHRDLARHQWVLDAKRWRPHVTLARKVTQPPVLQAMSSFDWPMRELCLVSSDTSGAQSAYTVVGTWPLLYDADKASKKSSYSTHMR